MLLKILIVGKNSFLSTNMESVISSFCKVDRVSHTEIDFTELKNYDVILNFSMSPNAHLAILSVEEQLDYKISKCILDAKTHYIFLSSRKVYGTFTKLKVYKEEDVVNPFDFYSINKYSLECKLQSLLKNKLTILRIANIIGYTTKGNNKSFIYNGVIEKILQGMPIIFSVSPDSKKDFITLEYLQNVLSYIIRYRPSGVFNIGSGISTSLEEVVSSILYTFGCWPIQILSNHVKDQFLCDTNKITNCMINNHISPPIFSKDLLITACKDIGNKLRREFLEKNPKPISIL